MAQAVNSTTNNANLDKLNLANNAAIKQLFANEGNANEKVMYSEKITKINRKGKKQDRHIIITNKAFYNLKPKKYDKSKRRVAISKIGMLTLAALSPEFAIHVPSEYDYHFSSSSKDQISEILKQIYFKETQDKLLVVFSEFKHLKDIIITKVLAKYENKNSKHAMSQTITSTKDILQQIDDNIMSSDTDDDIDNDINANYTDPDDDDDDNNNTNNTNNNNNNNNDNNTFTVALNQ